MNWMQNQFNALGQGFAAYRLAASGGPRPRLYGDQNARLSQYQLCWDAYHAALYDKRTGYLPYLSENNLYSKTRMIYAMVEDVVDFYAAHVYPGVIDDQGAQNSAALEQAIPLIADDAQRLAIKQIWQWSKWAAVSSEWLTFGAATGDAFLVVVDDVAAGRVALETRAPWQIAELHTDRRGHVILCVEQYDVWDTSANAFYKYRREFTEATIKTFRNGSPFDYDGGGAVKDNLYGFVPVSYTQHRFAASVPGRPAFRGWKSLDEVNSLASRLDDYIRTQADTPQIFSNAGEITPVKFAGQPQSVDERGIRLLQMSADGNVQSLAGNLDLAAAETRISSILGELRERNLEVTTYQRLREAGNVSGVAARRLLGDVESRLSGAAGNYDSGQILALRQVVAIAGMRANERAGGWADMTEQRRAFMPFGLDSYEAGDLDFSIAPRMLVPDTATDLAQNRTTLYQSYAAGDAIGVPVLWQMEQNGVSADDLKSLKLAMDAENGDGFPNLAEM